MTVRLFDDSTDLQRAKATKGNNMAHFDKIVVQDLTRFEPLAGIEL